MVEKKKRFALLSRAYQLHTCPLTLLSWHLLLCDFCCRLIPIIRFKDTIVLKLMIEDTDYWTGKIARIMRTSPITLIHIWYRNHNVHIISKISLKGWVFSEFSTQEIHEGLLFHHSLSARLSRSVEQLFCPTFRTTICFSRAWHPLPITKCGNGQLIEDACIWNWLAWCQFGSECQLAFSKEEIVVVSYEWSIRDRAHIT